MSAAAAAEHEAKRRIGDILLELGFVTEKQLAKAATEQEETGQPLGQILVEHGAITRLELASALAEQWSSHAPITPLPIQPLVPRVAQPPLEPHDEDEYAARLQAAVADLAQRVQETQAEEPADPRVTELAERLEATIARAQRLEATVATLAESLDGVTGGVEEAFSVLQTGMSTMALDLARIETALGELAAQPAPAAEAGLDALRASLDALQRQVTEADTREAIAADLSAQRATLDELHAAVAELARRPAGTPDLDERLARVESQLEARLETTASAAAVDALAARVEEAAGANRRTAEMLDALRGRVDELARPADGPGEDAVRRVEVLEARIAEIAPALEQLRADVATGREGDLAGSLDELGGTVAAISIDVATLLRERPDEALAETASRLDAIEHALGSNGALGERLDALTGALATLREDVERERLAAQDGSDVATRLAELDGLREALSALGEHPPTVSPDELAAAVASLRDELGKPDPRLQELADAVTALNARVAAVPTAATPDELTALANRLEHDLATLRHELEASRAIPTADPYQARALAELTERLDRQAAATDAVLTDLRARLDTTPTPATPEQLHALREQLESGLDELRREHHGPDERLQGLLDAVGDLRARLDTTPAAVTPDQLEALHAQVESRLASIRSDVDELAADITRLPSEVTLTDDAQGPGTGEAGAVVELAAHFERQREAAETRFAEIEARLRAFAAGAQETTQTLQEMRHEMRAHDADLDPRIGQLGADVLALHAEMARAETAAATPDPALAATVASLQQRIAELEQARGDRREPSLDERLDEIVQAVSDRLLLSGASSAGGGSTAAVSGIPGAEGVEGDLERARMAIERLSAHLGEHDRAIRELVKAQGGGRPRGNGSDPASTVEGAAGRAEAAADLRSVMRRIEGMEEDVREDRDKLMKRLERLATSIDWRLQRLESDQ